MPLNVTLLKQFHVKAIEALHDNRPKDALRILQSVQHYDKPKRSLSGYQCFLQKRLQVYKDGNYGPKTPQECLRCAVQDWKILSQQEKEYYKSLAQGHSHFPQEEGGGSSSSSPQSDMSDDDNDRSLQIILNDSDSDSDSE